MVQCHLRFANAMHAPSYGWRGRAAGGVGVGSGQNARSIIDLDETAERLSECPAARGAFDRCRLHAHRWSGASSNGIDQHYRSSSDPRNSWRCAHAASAVVCILLLGLAP